MKYLDSSKLKAARGERSMAEVGKAIGVSRQQVHSYENSVSLPRVDRLISLLDLYKVTLESVLSESVLTSLDLTITGK